MSLGAALGLGYLLASTSVVPSAARRGECVGTFECTFENQLNGGAACDSGYVEDGWNLGDDLEPCKKHETCNEVRRAPCRCTTSEESQTLVKHGISIPLALSVLIFSFSAYCDFMAFRRYQRYQRARAAATKQAEAETTDPEPQSIGANDDAGIDARVGQTEEERAQEEAGQAMQAQRLRRARAIRAAFILPLLIVLIVGLAFSFKSDVPVDTSIFTMLPIIGLVLLIVLFVLRLMYFANQGGGLPALTRYLTPNLDGLIFVMNMLRDCVSPCVTIVSGVSMVWCFMRYLNPHGVFYKCDVSVLMM